jgi:hypothetical protein
LRANRCLGVLAYILVGIWAILVSMLLIDYIDTKVVLIECISTLSESVNTLMEAVKMLL